MYFDGDMLKPIQPVINMNLGYMEIGGTEITTYVKSLMSFGDSKHDCKSTECSGKCKEFVCINDPAMVSSAKVIHTTNKQKAMSAKELVDHFREIDGHTVGVTLCDSRVIDTLGESHPVSKNRKRPAGYYKIYRSLKELRKEQVDSFDEGFSHLEQYLAALEEANPGNTITFQFTERTTPTPEDPQYTTKSFVRLFVMLKGQAECAARCKPVISYDGAFTKVVLRLLVQSICFHVCLYVVLTDLSLGQVHSVALGHLGRGGAGLHHQSVHRARRERRQLRMDHAGTEVQLGHVQLPYAGGAHCDHRSVQGFDQLD
jgi:hypothetical protein